MDEFASTINEPMLSSPSWLETSTVYNPRPTCGATLNEAVTWPELMLQVEFPGIEAIKEMGSEGSEWITQGPSAPGDDPEIVTSVPVGPSEGERDRLPMEYMP